MTRLTISLYVPGSVNCHLVGGQPPVCIKISPKPVHALHIYVRVLGMASVPEGDRG